MSIIPILIAAILLSFAVRSKKAANFKAKNWITTRGKIIEIKSYWTNRKHYAPFITFYTVDNQQFQFYGKGSQKYLYQVGQFIEVVYNPLNPNHAEIKFDPSDNEMRTIRFVIGGIFLFFAAIFFVIDMIFLLVIILGMLRKIAA